VFRLHEEGNNIYEVPIAIGRCADDASEGM